MNIELSPKQCEYIREATHRYNGKIGATQCGKTHIDIAYVILNRIIERKGKKGLNLILGVTKETIERNVLEPMRDMWGDKNIGSINSRNIATIFGEKVYCLGAEKVTQVSKLRGAKFKYAYIDEIVDISEEVFQLLKSRLSLDYSVCDFTGNPSYTGHWAKKFIDSDADVWCQQWTLYDNPFLSPAIVRSLEVEYAGTVYFDRYVLGQWKKAEGLVYPMFDPNVGGMHVVETIERPYEHFQISIDYGTYNPFSAGLWGLCDGVWYRVDEYRHSGRESNVQKGPDEYVKEVQKLAGDRKIERVIVDPSADAFIVMARRVFTVIGAKNAVLTGIENTATALQQGKIKFNDCCTHSLEEFSLYSWDPKSEDDSPIKENDHSMDEIRYFVNTNNLTRPPRKSLLSQLR